MKPSRDPVERHIKRWLRRGRKPLRLVKEKTSVQKKIDEWLPRDFLRFFQETYFDAYDEIEYDIPKGKWGKAVGMIKSFLRGTKISNAEYKNMIEWLFENEFDEKFQACLGLICSADMLRRYRVGTSKKKHRKKFPATSREEWHRIKKEHDEKVKRILGPDKEEL